MSDNISSEVRKYFEQVKKSYEEELIKPDEFTVSTFEKMTGLKNSVSKAALEEAVNNGKLTVRSGRNLKGIPCQLYKMVK